MRQSNCIIQAVLALVIAGVVFSSCRKQDILPEPVGEPVPYKGPDKTWQQLLEVSSYTYFQTAWKRSNMNSVLKKDASAFYTFFVPTDKAFQDAGWSLDRINTVAVSKLDTLLSYFTAPGIYKSVVFEAMKGNQIVVTLSKRTDLPNYEYTGKSYINNLFVGKHGDSLCINGIGVNKWGREIEGTNGILYPIEKLVLRPEKTMWQYLEGDSRFSLFMDAMVINDSLYQSDWRYINTLAFLQSGPGVSQFTLFAPTNAAFKKIGIQTTDDVRDYCMRVWPLPYPDLDENNYYVEPVTSLDSLLFPHGLEVYRVYAGETGVGPVYFSNDLLDNSSNISNLLLMQGSIYSNPPVHLSLAFSKQNEEPLVKRFGSSVAPVNIKEKNIRVTNGVIHVVDDLFLP